MLKFHLITALFFIFFGFTSSAGEYPSTVEGTDLISQKSLSFSASVEKPLVIVFLSAKCPCSDSHISELNNLTEKFKDLSFVAIHSNADEDKNLAKNYFTLAKLAFPIISDSEFKLANQFKALKTPHSFVINSTGEALYRGGVSDSADCTKAEKLYLRSALEDIAAKRPVKVAIGRALGCNISRGEKNVW